MFTCLKDYRTHPTSLEAALAIIIAVRSPRSLLALSVVKPLVAAYCSTAPKMYCAHQLYIQLAAYCSTAAKMYCAHQLYSLTTLMQVTYCLDYLLGGKNVFTCLEDYRTHPTSLEAALAIIIAVRSPRSLLALSAVKPLVAENVSLTTLMQVTYCLESWHVRRNWHVLARQEELARFGT